MLRRAILWFKTRNFAKVMHKVLEFTTAFLDSNAATFIVTATRTNLDDVLLSCMRSALHRINDAIEDREKRKQEALLLGAYTLMAVDGNRYDLEYYKTQMQNIFDFSKIK